MRNILEIVYFISGPLLVITSGLILLQIKLAKQNLIASYELLAQEKKDLKLRAKRDSIESSCEQIKKYMEEIVPMRWELNEYIKLIKLEHIKRLTFTRKDLKMSREDFDKWYENVKSDPGKSEKTISILNKLETFSIYFIKGIADESVAFSSMSISFCEIVEDLYPLICIYREDNRENSYFTNLAELYKLWKERIESINSYIVKDSLEKQLSNLKEIIEQESKNTEITNVKKLKPLGTEED